MTFLLAQVTPTPSPSTDVVDWWLRHGSIQGLAFVFLACVLLIFLWVAVVVVNGLKQWAPRWFLSSLRTQAAMRAGIREVIATARAIRRDTFATRVGLGNALRGLEAAISKPGIKEKLGIGSDVVVWLKNARREIERNDAALPKTDGERKSNSPPTEFRYSDDSERDGAT
jgi:hypothetical protein